jgi:FlaA1/EpsC-like NDP-sugar epimerase
VRRARRRPRRHRRPVSSDKAARLAASWGHPAVAEIVTIAHAIAGYPPPSFDSATLASSGSFVEIMCERIRQGRSIVLTDPSATRYS